MAGKTLATRYVAFQIVVPAGTTSANPQTTFHNLGNVTLVAVEVMIPPGHSFLTGIRFKYADQSLIPWGIPYQWVVGDADRLAFEVDFDVSTDIAVKTFNPDVFDHTFFLRYKVRDPAVVAVRPALALVPITPAAG